METPPPSPLQASTDHAVSGSIPSHPIYTMHENVPLFCLSVCRDCIDSDVESVEAEKKEGCVT